MAKLKTHRGAAKRFRKTKNGFKCRKPFRSHGFTNKTRKWKREQRLHLLVKKSDMNAIDRMLQGS